jgi:hypothetical protein
MGMPCFCGAAHGGSKRFHPAFIEQLSMTGK